MHNCPTICITPGDPNGIGPEITLKFLHSYLSHYIGYRFKIFGSMSAIRKSSEILDIIVPESNNVEYIDIAGNSAGKITYMAIEKAVASIASGQGEALVTGPISKTNLKEAGILSGGHTEILEILARMYYPNIKPKAEMLFTYKNLKMLLLTRHIPLNRVSCELMSSNIINSIDLLASFLNETASINKPRIALLAINPHAGEIGGEEESLTLQPVIDHFRKVNSVVLDGPFAADAFFRNFDLNHLIYDAHIATYHDQGLIPFKMIAGFKAVNVTIGLPFIRTSVSHGTAFDIAGKGIATEESLVEAVDTAIELIAAKKRCQKSVASMFL